MNVIDITSKIFTKEDKEELTSLLRKLAKEQDLEEKEILMLSARAQALMAKAGGAEKFFKNENQFLKDLLS